MKESIGRRDCLFNTAFSKPFSLFPDAPSVTLHLASSFSKSQEVSKTEAQETQEESEESVREGEDIELKCVVNANPKVHSIKWAYQVRMTSADQCNTSFLLTNL